MAHVSRASSVFQASKPAKPHKVRKKLFGGRETAQEVHRKVAWAGGKCYVCGSRDITARFAYHMAPKELIFREPNIASHLIEGNDGQLPIWHSQYGPLVNYWVEYSCRNDQRYVEREAAKLPSYILVEIDRGVGEDKAVVQVPL